jgi:hypothetical protein
MKAKARERRVVRENMGQILARAGGYGFIYHLWWQLRGFGAEGFFSEPALGRSAPLTLSRGNG